MKSIKLILISGEVNSNKFYNMKENGNGTFTAEYGRVGANAQTTTKSMSQWDKVYREKTNKGYKDNTDLFIEESLAINEDTDTNTGQTTKVIVKDFMATRSTAVVNVVKKLQGWAKGSIEENYTVSSENVTQKQVDRAQAVLNEIVSFDLTKTNIKEFNNKLIEFFGIVPRKMKQVKDHLISDSDDLTERKNKIISDEQDTLDVMAGQVALNANVKEAQDEAQDSPEVETDLIKSSGMDFQEVTDAAIIAQVKSLMANNASKLKQVFEVKNLNTQTKYDSHLITAKNLKEELFWHGSRNENWWSILTSGLLIRPSNAVHSGSMFGDGIYFADKFQKSYGYTSGRNSYWARGNSNEAVLALYSVHVGEQKKIMKHNSDCYRLSHSVISKDGYDSVFAQGGIDLVNNEYIVYQAQQCTVKYLVIVEA